MNTIQEVNYIRTVITDEINRLSDDVFGLESLVKKLKTFPQIERKTIQRVVSDTKKLREKRVALGLLSRRLKLLSKQFQRGMNE